MDIIAIIIAVLILIVSFMALVGMLTPVQPSEHDPFDDDEHD